MTAVFAEQTWAADETGSAESANPSSLWSSRPAKTWCPNEQLEPEIDHRERGDEVMGM